MPKKVELVHGSDHKIKRVDEIAQRNDDDPRPEGHLRRSGRNAGREHPDQDDREDGDKVHSIHLL